jgi:rubredoxin
MNDDDLVCPNCESDQILCFAEFWECQECGHQFDPSELEDD